MSDDEKLEAKFVSESLKGKSIDDIPGMTDVYAAKLKKQGIEQAYQLIGQFMVLKCNDDAMLDWVMKTSYANIYYAQKIVASCRHWCTKHMRAHIDFQPTLQS